MNSSAAQSLVIIRANNINVTLGFIPLPLLAARFNELKKLIKSNKENKSALLVLKK